MRKLVRLAIIAVFLTFTLTVLTYKVFASQDAFSWFETKTKTMSVYQPIGIISPIPTSIPTSIPTPTQILPTLTPVPTNVPTAVPTTSPNISLDDPIAYIMNAVNDYRRSKGLPSVSPDPNTCDLARRRAGEIVSNFNHDSFYNMGNNNTLPYPSYSQVTENLAMVDDYKKVVDLWINSPTHAENMQKDTPYVCVASSGYYYAYEGWKP